MICQNIMNMILYIHMYGVTFHIQYKKSLIELNPERDIMRKRDSKSVSKKIKITQSKNRGRVFSLQNPPKLQ